MKACPFFPLLSVLVASAGCQSHSYTPKPPSAASNKAALVAGAAGGAYLGNEINKDYGAPVGAAAGLAIGMAANYWGSKKEFDAYQAGLDEGLRRNRSEILQQYWQEKTLTLQNTTERNSAETAKETVNYQPGMVDGVRFGGRAATSPGITHPIR